MEKVKYLQKKNFKLPSQFFFSRTLKIFQEIVQNFECKKSKTNGKFFKKNPIKWLL